MDGKPLIVSLTLKLKEAVAEAARAKDTLKSEFNQMQTEGSAAAKKIEDVFEQNLKKVGGAAKELEHALGGVGKEHEANTSWIAKIKEKLEQLEGQAKHTGSAVHEAGEGGHGSEMGLGAIAGIAGVGFELKELFNVGRETIEREEEITIGLRTTGMSAEQAAKSLDKVTQASGETANALALNHAEVETATAAYLKMGGTMDNLPQKQEAIAALAQRAGIGMDQAAKLYAKSVDDETGTLSRLGITFEKGATQAERQIAINKALSGTIDGMKEAANGPIGSFNRFKDSVSVLEEKMGSFLFKTLAPVFEFLNKNQKTVLTVVEVLGAMAIAVGTVSAATAAWNAVLALNPITWIALAVGGLIAGLILLYQNVKPVHDAFQQIWDVIKATGTAIWAFVQNYVGSLIEAFKGVGKVIDSLIHLDFKGMVEGAKQVGESVVNAYAGSAKKAGAAFGDSMASSLSGHLYDAAREQVKKALDSINKQLAEQGLSPERKAALEKSRLEWVEYGKKVGADVGDAMDSGLNKPKEEKAPASGSAAGDSRAVKLQARYSTEKDALDKEYQLKSANAEREAILAGASQEDIKNLTLGIEQEKNSKLNEIAQKYHAESLTIKKGDAAEIKKVQTDLAVAEAQTALANAKNLSETDKLALEERLKNAEELAANAKTEEERAAKVRADNHAEFEKSISELKAHIEAESHLQELRDNAISDSMERELALAQDKSAKELALLDEEHAAKKISDEEYNLTKTSLEQQANDARLKILSDHLQKENVLYAGAMAGVKTIFSDLTKQVEGMLDSLFSANQAGTQNDIALANLEKEKKIQAMSDQVRTNKMTYQEFTLQKTKLDEDATKKEQANQFSVQKLAVSVGQSITKSIVGELAKRAEAWVADQLMRLALQVVYGATSTATGAALAATTAAMWAGPAALTSIATLGAADVAATAGIIATTAAAQVAGAPKKMGGAADSGSDDDIGGVYHKNEFIVSAAGRRAFGNDSFLNAVNRGDHAAMAMYQSGNIIPRVASQLAPGYSSTGGGDHGMKELLTKIHSTLDAGIDVTGKIDAKMYPRETEKATRKRNQQVGGRAYVLGGGLRA
jgi:hypothetical protein